MARIEHLAFIGGGVIVPRLSELALAILFPHDEPEAEIAVQATSLEREVARGTLAPDAYCRRLLQVSRPQVSGPQAGGPQWQATELSQAICAQLVPQAGVPSLLAELAPRLEFRLVCDVPRAWWETTPARHNLDQFFPRDTIYYTAEGQAPADYAAFFDALVSADIIRRGRTLWVDYHSPRTSAAIRSGIDATFFVDAARLKRDLGLWDLLPPSP